MLNRERQRDWFMTWLWMIAVGLTLILFVAVANAQTTTIPGRRFVNGDAFLVAGVDDNAAGNANSQTLLVCFRVQGGAELGCVPRSAFIVVGNDAFAFEGALHFIAGTLPAGQRPNFVAALRVPLLQAANVLVRAVDDDLTDPDSVERTEAIAFDGVDLIPRAPVLILIDALQSALEQARDQLALGN